MPIVQNQGIQSGKYSITKVSFIVFLCSVLVGLLLFLNYYLIVRMIKYVNHDFMTLWAGGRALIEGVDAYEPEEWMPLFERYGSTWIPNPRDPYPLWTSFLLIPFALFPINTAIGLWLTLSQILVGVCIYLLVTRIADRKLDLPDFLVLLLGAFFFRGTVSTITSGQLTIVLVMVIALFIFLMDRGDYFKAGLVLTLILLKPSPFILFGPFVAMWLLIQRKWRVIAGAVVGSGILVGLSWMADPGWIFGWLTVRQKTFVTYQTATVWGLSYEFFPGIWLWVGVCLTILITLLLGILIVRNRRLPAADVIPLALAASLFVTPYAWPYEHALLIIPLILIFCRNQKKIIGILIWFMLTLIVPWSLLLLANRRGVDNLSFLVPVVIGVVYLLGLELPRKSHNVLSPADI